MTLTLEILAQQIAALRADVEYLKAGGKHRTTMVPNTPHVDIDGMHGDPVVRKNPPRWKGDSYEGLKFSQCPPDFLLELASFKDWAAQKNDEKGQEKYATYDRLDAGRARAWAKRNEGGVYGEDDLPRGNKEPDPFA